MPNITIKIPGEKMKRVRDAFLGLHPNVETNPNSELKYNDNEWMKELVRRYVVNVVKQKESLDRHQALMDAAINDTAIPDDVAE